jgi:hypothetical protein
MVGVGVVVRVDVWVGVRVTVGVGEGEAVGVADGVDVCVGVDVEVGEEVSVCVTVGIDVGSGDGVLDALGGRIAEGNLVAVEAGLDKPQEREIRAKMDMNKSKLDLIGFCIDYQSDKWRASRRFSPHPQHGDLRGVVERRRIGRQEADAGV